MNFIQLTNIIILIKLMTAKTLDFQYYKKYWSYIQQK